MTDGPLLFITNNHSILSKIISSKCLGNSGLATVFFHDKNLICIDLICKTFSILWNIVIINHKYRAVWTSRVQKNIFQIIDDKTDKPCVYIEIIILYIIRINTGRIKCLYHSVYMFFLQFMIWYEPVHSFVKMYHYQAMITINSCYLSGKNIFWAMPCPYKDPNDQLLFSIPWPTHGHTIWLKITKGSNVTSL